MKIKTEKYKKILKLKKNLNFQILSYYCSLRN